MAKSIKNSKFENVSVEKIYDTLKSKKFLEELWCDLILDMKEKPSYNQIKEMVKQLITEKSDYLASPCNDSEQKKKKNLFAEISILGYTIDTILSQVLYNKLLKEFPSYIVDMINEFKAKSLTTENGGQSRSKNTSNTSDKFSAAVEEKAKITRNDSDSDSDLSDCNFSICSVSSVHTSDLSSYDDEVSLSSEDEGSGRKKKKISVKEASEKLFQGKVEEIYGIGKPAERRKKDKNQKRPKLENSLPSITDSPSRKTLPARIRKPNSKYSSGDILCPIKQFPNLDLSPPSEASSPGKDATPIRKRGRPRKNKIIEDSDITSLQCNAAAEDLSAIEVSNATMKLQANRYQRNNATQTSTERNTALTLYETHEM